MPQDFDVIVVADPRFQGGTTAAMVGDVEAFAAMGLQIGLLFVRSGYLDDARDPEHPAARALGDLDQVTLLAPGASARARAAFLHHPLVFFRGIEETASLAAERAVLVTHHPPFRADGSLEYDPITALRRARAALGLGAWYAPVSGVIRRQLESFAPFVTLTSEDWPNSFDTDAWTPGPEIFRGARLTIGRHGRADALKWPASGREIMQSLPTGPDLAVRVMGCPEPALQALGVDLDRWDVQPFGAETPLAFLHSLDIFAFHYHPNWVEAFGRTVAEAALTRRLCLLDPRLEPTFGEIALYCTAPQTRDVIARLRSDPEAARRQALRGERLARDRFAQSSTATRLDRLLQDAGRRSRVGASTPPLMTARKMAGLYRRRARGLTG